MFMEVFLNVLAIIGIVFAGGLIIYFLGGVLLSILETKENKKDNSSSFSQNELAAEQHPILSAEQQPQYVYEPTENKEIQEEFVPDTIVEEKFLMEDEKIENVNFDKAKEEKKSLQVDDAPQAKPVQSKPEQLKTDDIFSQDDEFNFDDFDFDAFFNEQNEAAALQAENANKAKAAAQENEPKPEQKTEQVAETQPEPIAEEKPEPVQTQPEAPVAFEPAASVVAETASTTDEVATEPAVVAEEKKEEIQTEPVVKAQTVAQAEVASQPEVIEQPAVVEIIEEEPVAETVAEQIAAPAVAQPILTEAKSYSSENFATVQDTFENAEPQQIVEKTIYISNHEIEDQLRAEIAELKAELFEQKRLYEALKAQADNNEKKWEEEKTALEQLYLDAEKREQEANQKTEASLSIEEYTARLEVLRERLKLNEKELKANRKEFIPLQRVRKNLDKDKSKLRRREALVAKQKVLLYGVNNITEIDQEKAKRLAEDLDLLDGLKISVKHCEEVMEANKERYPVLETANRILTTTNEEIKADILVCERAIRKLNGEDVDAAELVEVANQEQQTKKRGRGRPRKVVAETAAVQEAMNLNNTENDNAVDNTNQQTNIDQPTQTTIFEDTEPDTTILHTAQTENNVVSVEDEELENELRKNQEQFLKDIDDIASAWAERMANNDDVDQQAEAAKEDIKTEKKSDDLDDYEPSFEELFAIERDKLFSDDEEDKQ